VSGNGFVYGTAVYRSARPGEIEVTRDGDEYGERFQGPAAGPPRRIHLAPTPWRVVPDADWDQDETGAWWIRVEQDEDPAAVFPG
jgi:hypothetical protein